jgi:hypothetical protein
MTDDVKSYFFEKYKNSHIAESEKQRRKQN